LQDLAVPRQRAGAEIHENTRVLGLERQIQNVGSGWKVTTSRGSLHAGNVFGCHEWLYDSSHAVIAEEELSLSIIHYRDGGASEALAHELSPRNRMIYDSKHYLYYYA